MEIIKWNQDLNDQSADLKILIISYFTLKTMTDPNASIYVTGAGSLLCKSIVHVVTPKTPEQIKAVVAKALQRAEKDGFQSLSFPALGTGIYWIFQLVGYI